MWCRGSNSRGQLGDGTTTLRTSPVRVGGLSGARAVDAGWRHTCAVVDTGEAVCWGGGEVGGLGDGGDRDSVHSLRVAELRTVDALAVGGNISCAGEEGTRFCWGLNHDGQLGDGTRESHSVPVRVQGLMFVADIDIASELTCGLRTDGAVFCWGSNAHGRLGSPEGTGDSLTPVRVNGLP